MFPYFFAFEVEPLPENQDCQDVAGAMAHIWVMGPDMDWARTRALLHVAHWKWKVLRTEVELAIQPEQIPGFHDAEIELYHKALRDGVASDFIGWPQNPGTPDDPPIMRKLERT